MLGLLLLFLLHVDSLVSGQRRGVIEPLPAVRAGVTLPLRVHSLVTRQGGGMIEALVAVVAGVGFVSLALLDPLFQGGAVESCLPGGRRRVDPGLLVGLMVPRQRGGVVEAFIALGTGVGLPPDMDLLVLLQVALANKALPALVAFVGLVARVDPLVLSEGGCGREALPALGAPVGLVPRMGLLVLLQVGSGGKAFTTLGAGVRLLPGVELLVLFQVSPADKTLPALRTLVGLVL